MKVKIGVVGFTIIELMITVMIIGILSSIAIPAYERYTERAKVGSALGSARGLKMRVEQCASDLGKLEGCNHGGHRIPSVTSIKKLPFIVEGSVINGVITITTEAVNADGTQLYLQLESAKEAGSIVWELKGSGCNNVTPGRGIECY